MTSLLSRVARGFLVFAILITPPAIMGGVTLLILRVTDLVGEFAPLAGMAAALTTIICMVAFADFLDPNRRVAKLISSIWRVER